MSNQVEKLKNAEQTWRKHAENCGQKCLSTLILIYFPLMGLKLANWSSHLLWGKCEVVCELCILMRSPHTFVCVYLRHRAFCLGPPHLTKTTSPSRRRLVGLVSHDVSQRGSKRLPATNGVLNRMPHRHYSALSVVFWPPVRPSTKAGLVAPGDALQKHQFPLQAAKGWFADKPTVKKDAKDIKRLLCWRG